MLIGHGVVVQSDFNGGNSRQEAQRGGASRTYKSQIRNPKSETTSNEQKIQSSKTAQLGFEIPNSDFGSFGLFRISSFGFRISVQDDSASWREYPLCPGVGASAVSSLPVGSPRLNHYRPWVRVAYCYPLE
jgi:hypothetical protein